MFDAPSVITNYIEKHFRSTLKQTSRLVMYKEHPVPNTLVTKEPITNYLKPTLPRNNNVKLIEVQFVLLKMCRPIVCIWVELINNNLFSDPNASVIVRNILIIIQHTILLLENTNEMLSQLQRSKI